MDVSLVSICMITYNHAQYIQQAIEGILLQKTKFQIELVIGEDCSTDRTRNICLDYQSRYPDKIRLLLQTKNIGIQKNFIETLKACNGKYIAFCEGDDYWNDPFKLQKQIVFLEENKEYSLCFCRFKIYDQTKETLLEDSNHKYFDTGQEHIQFNFEKFYQGWHLGTQTMVFRQSHIAKFDIERKKYKYWKDIHLITYLLNQGKGVCLNFFGAVYRVHSGGIYSGASRIINAKISYQSYQDIHKNNFKNTYLKLKYQRFTEYYITILIENHKFLLAIWICVISRPEKTKTTLIEIYKESFKIIKMNIIKLLKLIVRKDSTRQKLRSFLDKAKLRISKLKPINKPEFYRTIKAFGLTETKRPEKIIISLTSFPPRIKYVKYTIETLLNQTLKPDQIILWLAETEFPRREKDLPKKLLRLRKYGLTIGWYKENIKAYKKLIPSLEEYPNDAIVTVDDDVFYRPDWLEILYETHQQYPQVIICHRAHRIRLEKNSLQSYNNWDFETTSKEESYLNFMTGVGGVLYPPHALHKDALKKEVFEKEVPSNDDIWFWAMALLNGTKIKVVNKMQNECLTIDNTQEDSLWMLNVAQGKNDIQLNNVLNLYPILHDRICQERS